MGLTTQKSISQASAWSSPYQNYDITAIATRSSKTSKAVTIKVTATIGLDFLPFKSQAQICLFTAS